MATIWTLSGTGALWINTVGVCAMSLNFMISPKSRRLRKSHSPVFNPISWSDIPWSSHSRAPGKVWGPPAWSHDAPKTSHTSNGSGDHNRNKGAKRLSWALSLLQNQCPNQHPIIAGSYNNVYIYISYNISVYFHIYVYIYIFHILLVYIISHLPLSKRQCRATAEWPSTSRCPNPPGSSWKSRPWSETGNGQPLDPCRFVLPWIRRNKRQIMR